MKKRYLLTFFNFFMITAHASPTLYGKVFLSADYTDTSYDSDYRVTPTANKAPPDENDIKLNSNYSRLGIKDTENITQDTKLVYQLEYGIDVDSESDKGQLYSRNTYIGLTNEALGTLLVGRHDSPFKLVKSEVDMFGNHGATLSIDHAGPKGYNNLGGYRVDNAIIYKSPKNLQWPVTLMTMINLSEQDNVKKPLNKEKDPNANGYSTSLTYDKNGTYIAVAYDKNLNAEDNAWRVVGSQDMSKVSNLKGLTLGALYQEANIYDIKDNAKTWLISGKYLLANTPWLVKTQYISSDLNDKQSSEAAIGLEYKFNKTTTGHVYGGKISHENANRDMILGTGIEFSF